jgi:hypothetical protein
MLQKGCSYTKTNKNNLVVCLSSIILFAPTIQRTKTEKKKCGEIKIVTQKKGVTMHRDHNQILSEKL